MDKKRVPLAIAAGVLIIVGVFLTIFISPFYIGLVLTIIGIAIGIYVLPMFMKEYKKTKEETHLRIEKGLQLIEEISSQCQYYNEVIITKAWIV